MQQELSKTKVKGMSLIRLFLASIVLALATQIIYESFRSKMFPKEGNVIENGGAVNFNQILQSLLFEYFLWCIVTFLVLLGVRFLYLRFVHRGESIKNLR